MLKRALLVITMIAALTLSGWGCGKAVMGSPPIKDYCVLTSISGTVEVLLQEAAGWADGEIGQQLRAAERIRTGAESSALVTFSEGNTIELQENTEVGVEELSISIKEGPTTVTLDQTVGTTKNRVAQLLDVSSSYEVNTPVGSAVVRGTEYTVVVMEDGTTLITVTEGSVWVTAQGETVLVNAGEEVIIYPGEPPVFVVTPPIITSPPVTGGVPPGGGGEEPEANFALRSPVGKPPLEVQFLDLSEGDVIAWLWDFGDNSISTDQNPTHIYEEPGIYTVTLTVTYADGTLEVIKPDAVTVFPIPGDKDATTVYGYIYGE